ncbi:hypothetical protein PFISCL1PPCAC_19469, partial [Pristionchus fissidentatus]
DPCSISLRHDQFRKGRRRDVYSLLTVTKLIKNSAVLVAPLDLNIKDFRKFVNGPSAYTRKAIESCATSMPRSIVRNVVKDIGRYQLEAQDNISPSKTLKEMLREAGGKRKTASDFIFKNLTTSTFQEECVLILDPMLSMRFSFKNRNHFLSRSRFVWINSTLLRIPCLLPVISAQLVLFSVRLLMSSNATTRQDDMIFLEQLLEHCPGMLTVLKPPTNVSFVAYFRQTTRARRLALEALLQNAHSMDDLAWFCPPYSMFNFSSMEELISTIEEEIKYCNEKATEEQEKRKKKIREAKNCDMFGDDPEIDEEDQELLQMGGVGYTEEHEVVDEIYEEEELVEEIYEEGEMVEEIEGEYDGEGESNQVPCGNEESEESRSIGELPTKGRSRKVIVRSQSVDSWSSRSASPPPETPIVIDDNIISARTSFEYIQRVSQMDESGEGRLLGKRNGESDHEDNVDQGASPPKKSMDSTELDENERRGEIMDSLSSMDNSDGLEEYSAVEDEKNEDAIEAVFSQMSGIVGDWPEEIGSGWDPNIALTTQDITRGFEEAQEFLLYSGESMDEDESEEGMINLDVPMTPGWGMDSMSSDDLPSPMRNLTMIGREEEVEMTDRISISSRLDDSDETPPRLDRYSIELMERMKEREEIGEDDKVISLSRVSPLSESMPMIENEIEMERLPASDVVMAPIKEICRIDGEEEEEDGEFIDEDDVDWVETVKKDDGAIEFVCEVKSGKRKGMEEERNSPREEEKKKDSVQDEKMEERDQIEMGDEEKENEKKEMERGMTDMVTMDDGIKEVEMQVVPKTEMDEFMRARRKCRMVVLGVRLEEPLVITLD